MDIDINELPMDVFAEILTYLDAATQHKLRRVCPTWNGLISSSPTLRRFVMLQWTILEPNLWSRGSSWRLLPMAFAACLGGETRVLLLRIEHPRRTESEDQWYPLSDYRPDWLEALFFDKELYMGAERLHTIILQGNGKKSLESDTGTWLTITEFPFDLPESVNKLMLVTINVTAEAYDKIHGPDNIDEIFSAQTIHKGSAWPWTRDGMYGGLKALAGCLGPLDASKEENFVRNLARHRFPPEKVLQALRWYEKRFGDAKVAAGLVQLDFGTLLRCQPWIQQVIYLRLQYYARKAEREEASDQRSSLDPLYGSAQTDGKC